ncbi:hypothetical protein CF70_022010 [Cupriavidus sp. SK-3]|uniref:lipase family protein n=1 Tax=Cupriavidus sp. SK-3 TaxID=1470558 RepID=UPI000446A3DE|nr:lipase family protein [Cupriavidus sp. SK-3]KDP84011.1 hypothetical protein CF70_022010 [Cupriavidus sp. SK-3]
MTDEEIIFQECGLQIDRVGELALLIADVFNACRDSSASLRPSALEDSLFARLAAAQAVAGYLVASDVLLGLDRRMHILAERVCYGVVLKEPFGAGTDFVVIRGTASLLEWLVNAECELVGVPSITTAGKVELGFSSIFTSMQFLAADNAGDAQPLLPSLMNVANGNKLVVTGHSLGAAIASYLTLGLAKAGIGGDKLAACLFASPRPGDQGFADDFQSRVDNYIVINHALDAVPKLPKEIAGFRSLRDVLTFPNPNIPSVGPAIRDDLLCHHHAVCYAALVAPGALGAYAADAGVAPGKVSWASLLTANHDEMNCIVTDVLLVQQNLDRLRGA